MKSGQILRVTLQITKNTLCRRVPGNYFAAGIGDHNGVAYSADKLLKVNG